MKRKRAAKLRSGPKAAIRVTAGAAIAAAKRPRLKRSAVASLYERGALGAEELRAAVEIERVYVGLTGALFARAGSYEGGGGPRVDLAESLAIAHRDRYKPWADALSARRKLGGPPLFEIAIACLVAGESLAALDRAWRWRHGKATDYLCAALALYARVAGWRREPAGGLTRPRPAAAVLLHCMS